MKPRNYSILLIIGIMVLSQISLTAKSQELNYQTPQDIIEYTYELMTFGPGDKPDWDIIKDLFIEDGVIVLRTSRTDMSIMDRDGFIELWIRDYEAGLKETGITEKKIINRYELMGDIATCYVIYAITIPGKDYPPQYGIDCFHLIKQNGRWYISSIVNEVIRPGVEPPEIMRKEFEEYLER